MQCFLDLDDLCFKMSKPWDIRLLIDESGQCVAAEEQSDETRQVKTKVGEDAQPQS